LQKALVFCILAKSSCFLGFRKKLFGFFGFLQKAFGFLFSEKAQKYRKGNGKNKKEAQQRLLRSF